VGEGGEMAPEIELAPTARAREPAACCEMGDLAPLKPAASSVITGETTANCPSSPSPLASGRSEGCCERLGVWAAVKGSLGGRESRSGCEGEMASAG
jgi:hypothetical protein